PVDAPRRPLPLAEAHAAAPPAVLPRLADDARWVAHDALGDAAHIVVDGASPGRPVLELSHWPGCRTPPGLADVTATGIAERYLRARPAGAPVHAVTNNHYDVDGVIAAWLLLERPAAGTPARTLAPAAAAAGDFATWTDAVALQAALALGALAERGTSPLAAVRDALAPGAARDPTGALHTAVLPRVGRALSDPERFRRLWGPAWEAILADVALVDAGEVRIDEHRALDLAVVRAPRPLRPEAVMPRTGMSRILTRTHVGVTVLLQRYETWVAFSARPLPPRADLAPAVARLQRAETRPGLWHFEGLAQSTPRLLLRGPDGRPGPTALPLEGVLEIVAPLLSPVSATLAGGQGPGA
ncbi:MAG TPA: DUF6687 family protein, partial [Miltoncostaeaceae bacterium]|nr:DUF6687 family protein [Miltoncostaeaceae bacterium]